MSKLLRSCTRARHQAVLTRSCRRHYSEGKSSSKPAQLPGHGNRTAAEQAEMTALRRNWLLAIGFSLTLGLGYELGKRNESRKGTEANASSSISSSSSSSSSTQPDSTLKGASPRSNISSTLPLSAHSPPQHDLSAANIAGARAEFVALLGEAGIDDHPGNRANHSSTEWSPSPTSRVPDLIVLPASTADVSAVLRICHRRRIPVTAFSGGTSLDGALAATRGGISLDFARMNAILAVHERDLDVIVQPGVGYAQLNERLEPLGLFFPLDPAPTAQIGGMVATGCSGTNAYRYGPMKDWTLGLTIVLADGTVVNTRHRPRKSSAGYDLTRLIVGSAGTLGIVAEANLKVTARPTNVHVAVVPFHSLHDAVGAVITMVQRGLPLEAVELLDASFMRAANEGGFLTKRWPNKPTLFLKFAAPALTTVQEQISSARSLAEQAGSLSFNVDGRPEEVDALWAARRDALPSFLAMKRSSTDKFVSSDVAVPISRMADLIKDMGERADADGLPSGTIGHVGDGNFHFSVLYQPGGEEEEKATRLMSESHRLAVKMGGTVTGEHGIGLALRDALKLELGDGAVDTMRRIKHALDPLCLLNCDKIVRMEAGEEH